MGKWVSHVLRISCALQEFKFPPKLLGYLRGPPLRRTNGAHVEVFLLLFESPLICKLYRYSKMTRGMKRSAQ
jgi:hypothetical protein